MQMTSLFAAYWTRCVPAVKCWKAPSQKGKVHGVHCKGKADKRL